MLRSCLPNGLLLLSILGKVTNGLTIPFVAPSPDVLAAEGLTARPVTFAAPASGSQISQAGWTVQVDSQQSGTNNEAGNAIDGNANTFWHTQWMPVVVGFPHMITVDMKSVHNIDGIGYLPRQDFSSNGNIGQHQVFVSTDNINYVQVAFGTWFDDKTQKYASFETVPARYIRLKALSEAGNRGSWTSAAEISVFAANSYTPPPNGKGKWGATIDFPLVPVAAALQPNGKVLTWSSYASSTFTGGNGGMTLTATFDPFANTVSQRMITNTGHDMFCPGISMDVSGRVVVTGGNSSPKTSIHDPGTDNWSSGPNLKIPRGYHASATCSDGRIFTIGGSWSGGVGGKNGEIYNPKANTWTLLGGCPVAPMLTADAQGTYRADNHGWLFGWKNGYVFQAGPSKAMNWYSTSGNGGQTGAGNRAADGDAMCGNAVMYDAVNGKILALGGAPSYSNSGATSAAHIITIGTPPTSPSVTTLGNMHFTRIFANAVVLPNGQVFITGGQNVGVPFSDNGAQLTPEMWDPATNAFTTLLPNSIPRTYHSFALLLTDATILVGGGGLCGTCSTNHFDAQVYTPQYLLNGDGSKAARPAITSATPAIVTAGTTITVKMDSAVTSMALVRLSSATHTVNTDQRRIPLALTGAGTNTYTVVVPNNYGVALPGYWMLFAMNAAGRPSVAKVIQIA